MRSVIVVEVQIRREPVSSLFGAAVCEAISPLTQQRLDKAFDLSICAWRVGSGAFVLDPDGTAEVCERTTHERRPVVSHHALDPDLEAAEPVHRVLQKGARGLAPLVRVDLCVRESGSEMEQVRSHARGEYG